MLKSPRRHLEDLLLRSITGYVPDRPSEAEYLINTPTGISYRVANWLPPNEAQLLCDQLRQDLDWITYTVTVWNNTTVAPRRAFVMSDPGAKSYTFAQNSGMSPVAWSHGIDKLRLRVYAETGIAFNTCLLNEYRDENDTVGYHGDREALGPNNAVMTISLGASRRFIFQHNESKAKKEIWLNNGDGFLMAGDVQKVYKHTVPREKFPTGYRISLTFRFTR